jgi:hypothetical protein
MQRGLRWFALVWAGGAYLALLRLPLYGQMSESITSDGSRRLSTGSATLAAVNGPSVYLILAVPVFAAALSVLPWPSRLRRAADVTAATIATAFVVLGLMTVGAVFLPAAAALLASALARGPATRPVT